MSEAEKTCRTRTQVSVKHKRQEMPIGVRKVNSTTHKGVCIDMNMYVLIKVDEYERNILQLK